MVTIWSKACPLNIWMQQQQLHEFDVMYRLYCRYDNINFRQFVSPHLRIDMSVSAIKIFCNWLQCNSPFHNRDFRNITKRQGVNTLFVNGLISFFITKLHYSNISIGSLIAPMSYHVQDLIVLIPTKHNHQHNGYNYIRYSHSLGTHIYLRCQCMLAHFKFIHFVLFCIVWMQCESKMWIFNSSP